MSLEKKIEARLEQAKQNERARCLWVLDEIQKEMEAGVANRLATPKELHVMKTKLRIAIAIVQKAKRGILTGVEPGGPTDDRSTVPG